jgi:trehalose-6-phosphate synthase
MNDNDIAPPGYGIYPGSSPEFRIYQKIDGTIEQHVRYINSAQGYVGKWMVVNRVEEKSK